MTLCSWTGLLIAQYLDLQSAKALSIYWVSYFQDIYSLMLSFLNNVGWLNVGIVNNLALVKELATDYNLNLI